MCTIYVRVFRRLNTIALCGGVFNYDVRSIARREFSYRANGIFHESGVGTYDTRTKNDILTVPERRFSSVDVVIRYLITMNCTKKKKKRALDIIPAIKQKSWNVYGRHSVRLSARIMARIYAVYFCFPVDSFCIVTGIVCLIRAKIHFGFTRFNCAPAMTPKNKPRICRQRRRPANDGSNVINRNRSDVKCRQNGRIRRRRVQEAYLRCRRVWRLPTRVGQIKKY